MNKAIEIESLPLDSNGQPILEDVQIKASNDVSYLTEDGVKKDRGSKVVVGKMDKRVIKIESANIGRTYDVYEGTKMTISVSDALNGQICPTSVILGEVVLMKGNVYELVYDKHLLIDETWTTIDRVTKGGLSNEMVPLYPRHVKTQAVLMDLLLKHESISLSPFVRMKLEHPVEIQEQLDLEALLVREKGLQERKKKAEEEFKLQEEKIRKDRKSLETKFGKK